MIYLERGSDIDIITNNGHILYEQIRSMNDREKVHFS